MSERSECAWFWIVVGVMTAAAIGLGVRLTMLHLGFLDVKKAPVYEVVYEIDAQRGGIFPATGKDRPYAVSIPMWEYRVDPKSVNLEKYTRASVASNVAEILQLPYEQVYNAYFQIEAKKVSRYAYLTTSYDNDTNEKLKGKQRDFGIIIEKRYERRYLQGRHLSHVVGFVTKDRENPTGVTGLELYYNRQLRGVDGRLSGERDANRRFLYDRPMERVAPVPGNDLFLTIDPNLQCMAEEELAAGLAEFQAETGWTIVMRVKDGAILAMASAPDFDPNMFDKFDAALYKNLAITENYEPGSVMKPLTGVAAMEYEIAGPQTMFSTSGGNVWIWCGKPLRESHTMPDPMSMAEAIKQSSNIVFAKIGIELGPERLWKNMKNLGLGQRTKIDLPIEEGGLLPNWKGWDKLKWSRAPIGQGVAVTALQLVRAYAAIANGGELVQPHLVARIATPEGKTVWKFDPREIIHPLKHNTCARMRNMMMAVTAKGGTARRGAVKGYSVAGKTGTAQLPGPNGRGYSQTDFNASFVGMIPATRPEVVILVTYHKPPRNAQRYNQGGHSAAPVFSRIAARTMRYLEIDPDLPEEMEE